MKGYKFRLEAVLDFRSREVDQHQGKVALAEKKRMDILNMIRSRDEEIRQSFQQQQQAMDGGASAIPVDLHGAQVFMAYIERIKNERAALQVELAQQAQRVNRAREELKQVLIKKKSLELLKEKEEKRFIHKIEKAEEAFLSELALNRIIHESINQATDQAAPVKAATG